jgi:glycine cleavage system H protein
VDQHRGPRSRDVCITQHAQDALGDVVFRRLPEVGRSFKRARSRACRVGEGRADIYKCRCGEIVEVNEALRADPSLANSDPLGKAGSSRST